MRKWTSVGLAFGFAAVVAMAADKEPQYQGRSFSDWTKQLDPHQGVVVAINGVPQPSPPAYTAIHSIGTNAIPILLKWIATKETAEHIDEHRPLAPCFYPSDSRRAVMVFGVLGETAAPAIPELTKLALHLRDYERVDNCVEALARIGPPALPDFKIILSKGSTVARSSALSWLAVFHSNAVVALPEAVACLAGRDEDLSGRAADELGRLDVPDAVLVPALTNALSSASAASRGRIIRCLFWRDQPAYGAVPSLRAALTDRDMQVRWEATNALQKIAPSVLTNTPTR